MINLREVAQLYLKKVFSDLHSAIVGIIVSAIILSVGGVYLFYKNLWISLKTTIQSPTPLWATIILVFAVLVYIYLKTSKTHSSTAPDYKIEYFTIDELKWKTKVYDNGNFEVERISICKEHDLPLINGNIVYYCPESLKYKCKNKIDYNSYSILYENAKSYIDKEVRNIKKC